MSSYSNQFPTRRRMDKPRNGVLVWIDNKTGRRVHLHSGPWALLQSLKTRYMKDPQYYGGRLKLTYE